MLRVLLAAIMLLAATCTSAKAEVKADSAYGVKYAEARVINLPQDENKLYLSVIGSPSDATFATIQNWFETVPELKSVKAQTHFNAIETTSEMYHSRYASTIKGTPCVRLQTADGTVVYECAGRNIPMSAQALSNSINTECLRRWRRNCCPKPQPEPLPEPEPEPDLNVPAPQPEPAPAFPWGLLAAVVAGGLLVGNATGVVKKMKDTYQGKK